MRADSALLDILRARSEGPRVISSIHVHYQRETSTLIFGYKNGDLPCVFEKPEACIYDEHNDFQAGRWLKDIFPKHPWKQSQLC